MTAVGREAETVPAGAGVVTVAGGIGRTNAAAATTEAILRHGPRAVLSVGVAGVLPGSELALGEIVVASRCVYVEEGLVTPAGFADMRGLGFPLGDFEGNAVPVSETLLARLGSIGRTGAIATVATCSGTDDAAREVVRRTSAIAEAMEGAAVVHAARRLGVPAIEIRAISNTTGDRERQRWDLSLACDALRRAMSEALEALRAC